MMKKKPEEETFVVISSWIVNQTNPRHSSLSKMLEVAVLELSQRKVTMPLCIHIGQLLFIHAAELNKKSIMTYRMGFGLCL